MRLTTKFHHDLAKWIADSINIVANFIGATTTPTTWPHPTRHTHFIVFILLFQFCRAAHLVFMPARSFMHVQYQQSVCILLPWKRWPSSAQPAPKWLSWRLPRCYYAVTSYANALLVMYFDSSNPITKQ